MEEDSLIKKYESFLKLNNLEVSKESAIDFTDLIENVTPLMLSMEYVNKGVLLKTVPSKRKYFNTALLIDPDNFAAKICNLEISTLPLDTYEELIKDEYDRLLRNSFLETKYYENGIVDFVKYQETFNYIRGIRSYYVALISANQVEKAISIGTQILELNPSDFFHVSASLAILYLSLSDNVSANNLINNSKNLIIGTKELVEAYCAFLNNDKEKTLEYLSDLESCNPYLYRLLTIEADMTLTQSNDIFSDSMYLFVHFSIIIKPSKEFTDIILESKESHPLLDDLTKDEILILETGILDELLYYNLNSIKESSLKYNLTKEISLFPDGRIIGALESLIARGIIKDYELTIYGRLFNRKIKESLVEIKEAKKNEALILLKNGSLDIALAVIKNALDFDPHDFELKKLYLFNQKFFDFNMAREIVKEINLKIKKFEEFYLQLDFYEYQKLIKISDEVSYRYYEESLKNGIPNLILSYTKIENAFMKYTYLIQMAQVLNNDNFLDDEVHAFYNLYKEYKEKGILSYERIKSLVKHSKMIYQEVKTKSELIPYKLLDPIFYGNLVRAIDTIELDLIIDEDEKEYLESFYETGNEYDLKFSTDPIYVKNTLKFLKSFWVIFDSQVSDYVLAPFVKEFLKKDK